MTLIMYLAILTIFLWCSSTIAGSPLVQEPQVVAPSFVSIIVLEYAGSACPRGNTTTAPTFNFNHQTQSFSITYTQFAARTDGLRKESLDVLPIIGRDVTKEEDSVGQDVEDCAISLQVNYTDQNAWKFEIKDVLVEGNTFLVPGQTSELKVYRWFPQEVTAGGVALVSLTLLSFNF
jgi:hypothetical protein